MTILSDKDNIENVTGSLPISVNHILQDVGPGQVRVSAVNDRPQGSGPLLLSATSLRNTMAGSGSRVPLPTQRLVLVTGPRLEFHFLYCLIKSFFYLRHMALKTFHSLKKDAILSGFLYWIVPDDVRNFLKTYI